MDFFKSKDIIMKNKFIAGNWKMNNTVADAKNLLEELLPLVADAKNTVAVCVPFTDLYAAAELLKGSNVKLGAQNVHWEQKGAFTGEISADMLVETGVEYVIIGHSERRGYFGDTDETVNKRLLAALNAGLVPILCVGESLAQRKDGATEAFLAAQVRQGLAGLSTEQAAKVVLAYEPIWAIGTGVTATNQEAQETIAFIRGKIKEMFGAKIAEEKYILYGGSMNEKNAAGLLDMPDIDGGLIGGASLKADKFAQIVKAH